MEALTRLVSESLARHGFDRPLDYRRLHWSRWFRCDSQHSLLFVPSKPGVFAVAEEIMDLGAGPGSHRDDASCGDSRQRSTAGPPDARRNPIFRRRRHGLRPRPHAVAAESHACPPRYRAATLCALSSSTTRPSGAASAPRSINGWSPPLKRPPASVPTSRVPLN